VHDGAGTIGSGITITAVQPITDDGIVVYEMWELTAQQDGQPITEFNEPLLSAD
jgi:hypothetical protein